ncbi:MAG: enoyl-CoA hydratase/isomerase family protein [Pseudomonadota bacterium]
MAHFTIGTQQHIEIIKHTLNQGKSSVGSMTLNSPDKRNALNWGILMLLSDAINESVSTGGSSVLIIKGGDEGAFCAGGELMEFRIGNFSNLSKQLNIFRMVLSIILFRQSP